MLDVQAEYTIADLCDTPEQLDAGMIDKALVKHENGIHLLARPNQFNQADLITAADCASVLNALRQMYEYVIVDGPVRLDPNQWVVLDLANTSLFVMQLVVTSVRTVHRIFEALQSHGYNLDRFKLVCNRHLVEKGHLQIEHVENTLNKKVDYRIPSDWKAVSGSVNLGKPLAQSAPKSHARLAIRGLAEAIAHPGHESAQKKPDKAGLLGRFFQSAT
jgi:pilus assembly protein CpaE